MGKVVRKLGFIMLIVFGLGSCSNYSSNGEALYLKSKQAPMLQVSPPLTTENISHFYDLPDQDQKGQVSIAPPVEQIKLQKR